MNCALSIKKPNGSIEPKKFQVLANAGAQSQVMQ